MHEIILIDDASQKPWLKIPLEEYLKKFPQVKLLRNTKRQGLIRTRLYGIKSATGDVVVILGMSSKIRFVKNSHVRRFPKFDYGDGDSFWTILITQLRLAR